MSRLAKWKAGITKLNPLPKKKGKKKAKKSK